MVIHFYFLYQKIRNINAKTQEKKYKVQNKQDQFMDQDMIYILLKIVITIKIAIHNQATHMNCLMEFKRTVMNQKNIQGEANTLELKNQKFTRLFEFLLNDEIINLL